MMLSGTIRVGILIAACASVAAAQTPEDGLFLAKKSLDVGLLYSHDSWNEYWEGSLKRSNDNIGTMTTNAMTFVAGYGLRERLSVIATLPYVWTRTSQGSLHSMSGLQDLTLVAKYRLATTPFTQHALLSAIVVGAAGMPASNYTPDFQPLSIGSASRRVSSRLTLNLQSDSWWFVNTSGGYTWRRNVRLDRNAYFTSGQLFLTNEVEMPDVVDYTASTGYRRGRLYIPVVLMQQRTLGGGDIRRQDMPFVSNRMDFVKLGGSLMYGFRVPEHAVLQLGTMRTLSGRNVGQSTCYTAGLMYTFQH